jgi:hypothetical protein
MGKKSRLWDRIKVDSGIGLPTMVRTCIFSSSLWSRNKVGVIGVSEIIRKNKKGGVIIPDDNIT